MSWIPLFSSTPVNTTKHISVYHVFRLGLLPAKENNWIASRQKIQEDIYTLNRNMELIFSLQAI